MIKVCCYTMYLTKIVHFSNINVVQYNNACIFTLDSSGQYVPRGHHVQLLELHAV